MCEECVGFMVYRVTQDGTLTLLHSEGSRERRQSSASTSRGDSGIRSLSRHIDSTDLGNRVKLKEIR
jgi:hypothetical protein